MKRQGIGIVCIFLSLLPIQAVSWNGAYLGVGLGCFIINHEAEHLYHQYNTVQNAGTKKGFVNQTQRQQYSQEVFGGYGRAFKRIYLGGELFVRYHHYDGQYLDLFRLYPDENATTNPAYSFYSNFSLESQYSLGSVFRGGYWISPNTLVYGVFGLEANRFRLSIATDIDGLFFVPNDDLHSICDQFAKWKVALVEGIGIEATLPSHLLLRTQFVYANYSKFNSKKYQMVTSSSSSNISSFQLKDVDVAQYIFTVGLIYSLESIHRVSMKNNYDFDGFYIGMGIIDSHSKDRYTLNSGTGSQMSPVAYDLFHAYKGPAGKSRIGSSILGGYSQTIGHFYGGAEFIYRRIKHHYTGIQWFESEVIDNMTTSSDKACYIADLKTDYSYGLVARLGYLIDRKTVVYGIAGLERTRFNIETRWYEDFCSKTNLYLSKWHHAKTGFISGLGIETSLGYRLSLRGQYTYTSYPAIKPARYVSPPDNGMFPGDLSYQHNMYDSTVTFGLVYHL